MRACKSALPPPALSYRCSRVSPNQAAPNRMPYGLCVPGTSVRNIQPAPRVFPPEPTTVGLKSRISDARSSQPRAGSSFWRNEHAANVEELSKQDAPAVLRVGHDASLLPSKRFLA